MAKRSAVHAETIDVITELIDTEAWRGDGAGDFAAWMSARWQVPRSEARDLIRQAEALRTRPALKEALASGSVSVAQSKAITTLSREETDDAEQWLEVLPLWSYDDLEREARKARARELERRDDGVYLRMEHTRDERYLRGEFQVHPDQGATIIAAIDARIPDGTKLRDYDRAAARALFEMASEPVVRKPSVKTTVLVAVDDVAVSAWARGVAAVGLGSRTGFVSDETAQRLACDSTTQILVKDERGNVKGVGHARRDISPATRRAVFARDHGLCTFPGCGRERYLEVHHVVPRADGGSHDIDNLLLVCWTHHELVHEYRWSLRGEAGRNITWVRPDGQPFEPRVRVTLDTS